MPPPAGATTCLRTNMRALTRRCTNTGAHAIIRPHAHEQEHAPHHTVLHRTAPHCTAQRCSAPHRTAQHHAAPRCSTPRRNLQHCTPPRFTVPHRNPTQRTQRNPPHCSRPHCCSTPQCRLLLPLPLSAPQGIAIAPCSTTWHCPALQRVAPRRAAPQRTLHSTAPHPTAPHHAA